MVSSDNHPFGPILVSLSLFSFIAKSVKLHGIPIILVVDVVVVFVIHREWMSRDQLGIGYSNLLNFFTVPVKNEKYLF